MAEATTMVYWCPPCTPENCSGCIIGIGHVVTHIDPHGRTPNVQGKVREFSGDMVNAAEFGWVKKETIHL